jgi:hypothetical protein
VKVLLPAACVLLLGAAIWQLLVPDRPGYPWVDYNPFSAHDWIYSPAGNGTLGLITQIILTLIGVTLSGALILWIMYAAASGRNLKQRLTDPAPIEQAPAV